MRFLRYWGPVIVWAGSIFNASGDAMSAAQTSRYFEPLMHWLFPRMPHDTVDLIHFYVRKTAHLSEYAILALLLARAIAVSGSHAKERTLRKTAFISVGVAALYAASDEFHQSFVPSRGASVHDVLIDTCGAAIGMGLLLAFAQLKRRLSSPRPQQELEPA